MVHDNGERSKLVAATVNRLRLVQADLADEDAQVRQEHLEETVRMSLSRLVPQEREAFLAELEEAFPSWDRNEQVREAQPVASATDQRELKDPGFLVSRLVEVAGELSDVQRRVIAERLAEAGLVPRPSGGASWPAEAEKLLRSKLPVGSGDVDGGRLMEMSAILAALTKSLDQLVWTTWRQISPRSSLRRPSPLDQTMARFLSGDGEVGRAQVAQDAERLRQLIAALVAALRDAGRQFALRHAARFSPREIESIVGTGGIWASKEQKCWQKYVELAETLGTETIENEINQAVAESAEAMLKLK